MPVKSNLIYDLYIVDSLPRLISKGIVGALSFCHNRDVAHGSLGSGSVLLSTYDARDTQEFLVKFDNFGFARYISPSDKNGDGREALIFLIITSCCTPTFVCSC